MELIADILLITAALSAGFYCYVLSRRLKIFQSAEGGVGSAVKSLSIQVDDLNTSVDAARQAALESNQTLGGLTMRAESVANRLELLVASMHDLEDSKQQNPPIFSTRMAQNDKTE